jgi:choline dehydrogenase-like flavoprotein
MARYEIEDSADYVIVGTGAGGATAGRVLAGAGLDVLFLEEGPELPRERPRDLLSAMSAAVRDMGSQTTTGATPMPLLQGRAVGGSTAINSGIIWRLPDDVRADWTERFGLGRLVESLDPIFETIEDELEVDDTSEDVRGGNAARMAHACKVLGLPGKPISRNARRCRGSARCLQGCPNQARQSMDVSYIPRARKDGARLHTHLRVERVHFERGRASSVSGRVLDRESGRARGKFHIRGRKAVILAAGVVHTPLVLERSGLKNSHVGRHFQAHPGLAVVGRFPESIGMGYGATQAYEVPMRERGFKLEALSLPPEMLAARIPGAGRDWQSRLNELDHYAQWAVQARMRAEGTVRSGFFGPSVHYEPLDRDLAMIQSAAALLCRMMFAAGATEVYPGLGQLPETIRDPREVEPLDRLTLRRKDFHLVASHLFGTARASADPARGVVGANLEAHGAPGLFVMDASIFPTNLGVNPQHSIMGVVWRAAEELANARATVRAA